MPLLRRLLVMNDYVYNIEMDYSELALQKHKQLRGKIEISAKGILDTKEAMSTFYTPGVGAVASFVAAHPDQARDYTWINNSVAVVSDGSAVLGLGNIGPLAALPVMEGKAMLFKHFAGIDAVPVVLDVHSADEIVATVKAIAPGFGGINLEDIAAPICFEVEKRLKTELSIPVFHDDQHGTAIVVMAGLINALTLTGRTGADLRIVVAGVGAAGTATMKLLHRMLSQATILAVDSKGIVSSHRPDLNKHKLVLLEITNKQSEQGGLTEALKGADVFIGVSRPDTVTTKMVQSMAKDPIIFALSNPVPEIFPDEALSAGAAVVATGRSDFANQVNNSLAFPGIFRGALDNHIQQITDDHKIAAAQAIAALVPHPTAAEIIPGPFTKGLMEEVARVIR
jgi:malate dehydrogenase (oxaloacetate-decarboxylating)